MSCACSKALYKYKLIAKHISEKNTVSIIVLNGFILAKVFKLKMQVRL